MDADETSEAYDECMRVREKMRLALRLCRDDDQEFAILAVGKAAKEICTRVERGSEIHEPTYETVLIRAEILGAAL